MSELQVPQLLAFHLAVTRDIAAVRRQTERAVEGFDMTDEQLKAVGVGDIVQHKNGNAYIVIAISDKGTPIAVRHIAITNASEWNFVTHKSVPTENWLDGTT